MDTSSPASSLMQFCSCKQPFPKRDHNPKLNLPYPVCAKCGKFYDEDQNLLIRTLTKCERELDAQEPNLPVKMRKQARHKTKARHQRRRGDGSLRGFSVPITDQQRKARKKSNKLARKIRKENGKG